MGYSWRICVIGRKNWERMVLKHLMPFVHVWTAGNPEKLPADLYLAEHDYPAEFVEEMVAKLGRAPIVKVDDALWENMSQSRDATVDQLRRHLALACMEKETKEPKPVPELEHIVGDCQAMRTLKTKILRYAVSERPVLILGETGTGKDLVAQALHQFSSRKCQPFIVQNCAAIPMTLAETEFMGSVRGAYTGAVDRCGLFSEANKGTLFLDEIGDLEKEIQVKFLRVLETGDYRRVGGTTNHHTDFRLVSATNRDLKALVAAGTFREDLFHRINTLILRIPPLRERGEDIFLLAQRFHPDLELSEPGWNWLRHHPWPGNVRELKAVLERAVMNSDGGEIDLEHFEE